MDGVARVPPTTTALPSYWTVAAVILVMAVLQAMPDHVREVFRFDRRAALDGEAWRLVTGHLVHLGWAHWALNALGLVLGAVLADGPLGSRWLLGQLATLAIAVSLMLLVFDPQLTFYVGMSGVLYGLFVLVLWPQARRGSLTGVLALAAVLGWMAWQLLAGPLPGEMALIGGSIVTEAHLYGVVAAVAVLVAQGARGLIGRK